VTDATDFQSTAPSAEIAYQMFAGAYTLSLSVGFEGLFEFRDKNG
jgi:hypothetical protein